MRFKIHLALDKTAFGNVLPINYQYELASWIYHTIGNGNRNYADWLHENGFKIGNKRFKFFTFSKLNIPQRKINMDRLTVESENISFQLSFLPEKSTEEFIKGVFSERECCLGDKKSKVLFHVSNIELIPPPDLFAINTFTALSPLVISIKQPDNKIKYISPSEDFGYGELLLQNLKEKYKIYYDSEFSGNNSFFFESISPVHSNLIKIKAYTKQETRIRGFNFSFQFKADPQLVEIGYKAGFGEKGSMGFGMVKAENQPNKYR